MKSTWRKVSTSYNRTICKLKSLLGNTEVIQEICDSCKPEILNISAKLDEQQGLNERLELQVRDGRIQNRVLISLHIYFSSFVSSLSGYFRIFNSYVLHYR